MPDWDELAAREESRYADGEARLGEAADRDARQRQLTRMANAGYGAALAHLMAERRAVATEWFARAADRYRESYVDAPRGSWGRPIGVLKAHVLADDWVAAAEAARWTLDEGAATAASPIGRYAAALALLVLGREDEARATADELRRRDDFPAFVGDALAYVAADDPLGYVEAIENVLESFETRDEYLEDVPVADTVLVLQALAGRRGLAVELNSALLPAR